MCLSPISIRNPYYGSTRYWDNVLHDTKAQMLSIRCGYCSECIAQKQLYLVQRVQMESLDREFFFCTLTYDNEHLPVITTSTGYDIAFADYRHIQLLIKRMTNERFPNLRTVAVSEFGSKKGRPHFHLLFSLPRAECPDYNSCLSKECELYEYVFNHWAINVGSKRKPLYEPLFTYVERWKNGKLYKNFDLHYVAPSLTSGGVSDVAFYVLKYMLKASPREVRLQQALRLNLPEDEYETVWDLVKPRCVKSLGFGLSPTFDGRKIIPSPHVVDYIRNCVSSTPREFGFPWYFAPDSGIHFPLSYYYRSKPIFYNSQDALDFYYKKLNPDEFNPRTSVEINNAYEKFKKRYALADEHFSDSYFSNL